MKLPYGFSDDGHAARCINAEPGTFGHECGKPAAWVGVDRNGFEACFCDGCKDHGHEARDAVSWRKIGETAQ